MSELHGSKVDQFGQDVSPIGLQCQIYRNSHAGIYNNFSR